MTFYYKNDASHFKIDWILGNDPYDCFITIIISTHQVRSLHRIAAWDALVTRHWWNLGITGIQKLLDLHNSSIPQGPAYQNLLKSKS
jgi:hypothetical protein